MTTTFSMKPTVLALSMMQALLSMGLVGAQELSNWPSFLGVGRQLNSTLSVPLEWNASQSVAWQTDLPGYGQSSPVVWNGHVYVTCIDGPKKEMLRVSSIDLDSGKIAWTYELATANLGENSDFISRAAPTPVADDNGVYAGFEAGDVVALDHQGNVRWKLDLVEKFGPIQVNHGIGSSLAQHGELIYVWIQRKENPYLVALKKSDGSVVWKSDRPAGTSWSSPVVVPITPKESHLVLSCMGASAPKDAADAENAPAPVGGIVCGLDLATGQELWRVEGLSGNTSQSPTIVGLGKILIGASSGRDGGSGKQSIGTNGLIRVEPKENGYQAEYVWRSKRASSGFCSPCYHAGYAYFTDRRGQVFCLDAETGDEAYTERLGQSVWATPLGIGDKIFFVGESGSTFVFKAGPQPEKLATNVLWEGDAEEPAPPQQESRKEKEADTNAAAKEDPAKPAEPPKTKPRQYAIVSVDNTLLIRRGDVLYAIR